MCAIRPDSEDRDFWKQSTGEGRRTIGYRQRIRSASVIPDFFGGERRNARHDTSWLLTVFWSAWAVALSSWPPCQVQI